MNTRKCSNCGWVFQGTYPRRTCKFCGTILPMGYCCACGEWSEKLHASGQCPKCRTASYMAWSKKKRARLSNDFDSWCALLKVQPNRPLTEAEWLEACRYFKGCAFCGADQIDARELFIPYKYGGKYCAWNIVPACESCANRFKNVNPFLRMDNTLNRSPGCVADDQTGEHLQRIVDYLKSRMEVTKVE